MFTAISFPSAASLALCLTLASALDAGAAPAKAAERAALDTAQARKMYLDGDFDQAIQFLEEGLKRKPAYTHDDSVFIFKHLGVMYAAKYETRERGKMYMHQLLSVEPTARILDMYASDMIYMIFKNIQDEFESNRVRLDRAENHLRGNGQSGGLSSARGPEPVREPGKPRTKVWAWVGLSSLVAAGVATYIYFQLPEEKPAPHGEF